MKIYRSLSAIAAAAVLSVCSACSETKNVSESQIDPLAYKTAPQDVAFEWQDVYEDTLKLFKLSDRYTDKSMFELIDLTGDDMPELVISPSDDVASKCEIYRYISGRADLISTAGSYGTFDYIPSEKAVGFSYEGEGFEMGEYQVYEDGSFNTAVSFYNNAKSASTGAVIRYEINDDIVTLAKYQEALLPYQDAFTIKAGRKFSAGDETINYAIRYSESWSQVLTVDQKEKYRARLNAILEEHELKDAAFELVDLDVNGLPEVVVSTGLLTDSDTRILYLDVDGVKDITVSSDVDGGILFDVKSKIFYAVDFYGTIQCWSLAGSDVNGFKPSESIMHCGRKYDLTAENINSVFATEVQNG